MDELQAIIEVDEALKENSAGRVLKGGAMTEEQKFLIDNNFNDVVTNRHERNPEKFVYVSDILKKFHNQQQQRLQQMENSLHMALCIIENDTGRPTAERISEVRTRWVAEIEHESGIDRERVMKRTERITPEDSPNNDTARGRIDTLVMPVLQPMKTAPKDGTRIIIVWYNYGYNIREAWWWKPTELHQWESGARPHWKYINDHDFCHSIKDPNGWMPKPELLEA